MRENFAKHLNLRSEWIGKVKKFGEKTTYKGYVEQTVLLVDVINASNETIHTDHIWLTVGKNLRGLKIGMRIKFTARISEYLKGYLGSRYDDYNPTVLETDYRLSYPSRFEVLSYEG
jgi:hypothetical protein